MTTDPTARVRELLDQYDTPTASAAELLCDRHPADDVAFTVVESDLSSTDLTYGYLREHNAWPPREVQDAAEFRRHVLATSHHPRNDETTEEQP